MNKYVAKAQEVLKTEIQGIQDMSESLDHVFADVVELFSTCKGKIIVSGMGKSGHVGKKIAATFASTGTPSYFVHPGEASHGDLGMISSQDILLLLSNSGETHELNDLISYAKRFGIKIASFVRRRDSNLAENSDFPIILPNSVESNSIAAPTTSTLMMMALGDALAVCLIEKQGFCSDSFKIFHPGGKIGANLKKVSDMMHVCPSVPIIDENAKMSEAILEMTSKSLGCVAVVSSERKIIGIITDGDLRRHMKDELLSLSAFKVMSNDPITISPTILVVEALEIMNRKQITSLFVVDEKNVVIGILHIHDCLKITG